MASVEHVATVKTGTWKLRSGGRKANVFVQTPFTSLCNMARGFPVYFKSNQVRTQSQTSTYSYAMTNRLLFHKTLAKSLLCTVYW